MADFTVPDDLPGAFPEPVAQLAESIDIAAPPAKVWELVTALDRYGEWSPENTGGYWRTGDDGEPGTGQVGDMFVGVNQLDGEEWKAPVEIIQRVENQDFAFVTGGLDYNIVLWRYQLEPTDAGTRLTESWTLRQLSPRMIENGDTELQYRTANAAKSLTGTLAAMKSSLEG
jgi:hypothetical protein